MHREIINAMDIDELRNYVVHLEEQISACHGVMQNQKEIIDMQRRLISNMPFMYDAIRFEEHRQYNLHQLEFALRSKYEDLILQQTGNVPTMDGE
jgi:hypothetical protein